MSATPVHDVATLEQQSTVSRPKNNRRLLLSAGPAVALVVLAVAFAVLTPGFATVNNARAIVEQASIPLVLAMGSTLVVLLGSVDLSVEGVMAACGLTFVLLASNNRNDNDLGWLAFVIAIGVGAVFGVVNGLIHTRIRVPSFMVTLGTWFIGLGMATVLFGTTTPQLQDQTFRAWAGGRWLGVPVVIVFAALVTVGAFVVCRYSKLGRYTYAIGGDEAVSRVAGIPVNRFKVIVFCLAGALSGLGGVLATIRLGVGDVSVGSGQLFLTLSAVVLGGTLLSGGRGGPLHTLVGVLILVVLGNGLLLSGANPYVQQAAQGLVIVIAVIATGWPVRDRLRVVK
ncbi:ribose transport system permease protein [Klenkia soli]|uniref:Ribose transport system permease protein n=1 Tax=Klenkia soli TaxID=1052260 RepID=A0A1H0G4B7_9ACTN|nr:ABC transporter permease [Klenkia soli]SDO01681.1 ribose transport system permease protein [Klenkia soli]